jgi:hypothetical protein
MAKPVEVAAAECLDRLFFIQAVFNRARLVPGFNPGHLG